MARWPKTRPLTGSIRRRKLAPRRYGLPPREVFEVRWSWPPQHVHLRRFATLALAEDWLARVRADPELGTGERLQKEIRGDRERRNVRDIELRAAFECDEPDRRLPWWRHRVGMRRSPYRYKAPPPSKLGNVRPRLRDGKPTTWVIGYRDKQGDRHLKSFASHREAVIWRELRLEELAGGVPQPPTGSMPAPMMPPAEPRDGIPELLAAIAVLRRTIAGLPMVAGPPSPKAEAELTRLADSQADMRDQLRRLDLLIRREVGLVEQPRAPRHSRRRPLGVPDGSVRW